MAAALGSDPRVVRVLPPQDLAGIDSTHSLFPDEARTSPAGVLHGTDAFVVREFRHPICFQVRVPAKNQPLHFEFNDVPTDTYYVAWDGMNVVVMWVQGADDFPMSAGQVVADIVADAVTQCNGYLYIQNCSPGCTFNFAHRTLRLGLDEDVELFEIVDSAPGEPTVDLFLPGLTTPLQQVDYVAAMIRGSLTEFAEFKNYGRRLIDLETAVRIDLTEVLSLLHRHSEIAGMSLGLRKLRARWSARRWRREARALVARTWLGMANIEALSRQWQSQRDNWMNGYAETFALLEHDSRQDIASVESLQLDSMVATTNQVSAGLDNRTVVLATAWGAIAGGLAGGLAGVIGS